MLDTLYLMFQILAGLVIFASVWGLLPLDHWWIRGVDFPRIQILFIGLASLIGLLILTPQWQMAEIALMLALIGAIGFQLRMILPYTRLWKQEVRQAMPMANPVQVKLMVSNVLTPNNNTQALVNLVQQKQPDILITLESDQKWEDVLSVIEPDYPYSVKVPLDNLYGMHLYSKLELIDPEIKYLLIDDIPSIHTQVRLTNGEVIWLYCLHPMPPSPTEADKSTTRDAELLMVGRHINENNQTAILAGDLNDVAWSKTTLMFQRISGLLDPRIGRFFINTFHVKYPILRWALDHIFHSPCFTLVDIERLPSIGSDHFPVMTTLQYEQCAEAEQAENATEASAKDKQETAAKIEEGKEEGERLSKEHAEEEQAEQNQAEQQPQS
ncbi:endonuclease/exonuclease/phosphatase family protein [Psychrobacter sanguinis]|uniref:endonuclease/exonuclease/phosphatase family protein n=1 Tax=Psychrobacter sanguinis TaxID=861445 RepID=UPI001918E249|nr:endonuclease/exonuclease/phosphatase family protein [Psychrobacter sanguinis]MCC3307152.1 endonuclease/exonuclease/phosphatase family protein [Psychrobacter sanguinis]UEC24516.1 endonuclease/exonuclease/phosphatase family protein [Psychrobacter sanguinis]